MFRLFGFCNILNIVVDPVRWWYTTFYKSHKGASPSVFQRSDTGLQSCAVKRSWVRRMSGSQCCCACDKENRRQPETHRPVCFLLVQIITFHQPGGTRTKHHGRVTFLAGRRFCVLCSHLMRLLRYIEILDRYRNLCVTYRLRVCLHINCIQAGMTSFSHTLVLTYVKYVNSSTFIWAW